MADANSCPTSSGPVKPIIPEEAEKPPDLLSFFPVSTVLIIAVMAMFQYDTIVELVEANAYELGVDKLTFTIGSVVGILLLMVLAKYAWFLVLKYKAYRNAQAKRREVMRLEKEVLIKIYNSMGGAEWKKNTNWITHPDVSMWKGVKMNHQTGRVNKILLADNNLVGSLPPEIGTLEELIEIDLRINRISGEIPESLCSLKLLEGLYLFENDLEGKIPEGLSRLPALKGVYLLNNHLDGVEEARKLFRKALGPDCIIYI